jgi:hypothetical protein
MWKGVDFTLLESEYLDWFLWLQSFETIDKSV